ncbi:hypothetical protein ACPCDX_23855 [Streptomyces koyangensis]|uniref:hypothetical protein n=1 Tax=Streptomyces koyangensis TaxID=188770 RepID=UPI003C2C5529
MPAAERFPEDSMVVPSHSQRCAHHRCRKLLTRTARTGRRRIYCDDRCRRQAQRDRDRARLSAAPGQRGRQSPAVADGIGVLAQELLDAVHRDDQLAVRLKLAALLGEGATCYAATAVQDARAAGWSWSDVARAAEVSEASARARWSEAKVAALVASYPRRDEGRLPRFLSRGSVGRDGSAVRPAGPSARAAAAVMRTYFEALLETGPVGVDEVARQAGLAAGAVGLILAGEVVGSWPVTHTVVTILGGQPQALRGLWETTAGCGGAGRRPALEARRLLHEALRVLYLAAGSPAPDKLEVRAGLMPGTVREVLDASSVPSWSQVALVGELLGVHSEEMRPLWEEWARARDGAGGPRQTR